MRVEIMELERKTLDAQHRVVNNGFICEIDKCKNEPHFIVKRKKAVIVCCEFHKQDTDVIQRYFNKSWRVWERP